MFESNKFSCQFRTRKSYNGRYKYLLSNVSVYSTIKTRRIVVSAAAGVISGHANIVYTCETTLTMTSTSTSTSTRTTTTTTAQPRTLIWHSQSKQSSKYLAVFARHLRNLWNEISLGKFIPGAKRPRKTRKRSSVVVVPTKRKPAVVIGSLKPEVNAIKTLRNKEPVSFSRGSMIRKKYSERTNLFRYSIKRWR